MNMQLIIVFLAGMLVAGGLFSLGRSTAPETKSSVTTVGSTTSAKRDDVEALERKVDMLTQALDAMGGTGMGSSQKAERVPVGMDRGETDAQIGDEPASERDPLAPRMLQLLEDDEAFRERMREIFQADRRERREVNSAKRFARWMERLTTKLAEAEIEGLSASQQADLEGILEEERQQVRSGFRQARRGELTWDEARDQAIKMRELSNEKIKPLLGDEQFAAFEELRRRARGPR